MRTREVEEFSMGWRWSYWIWGSCFWQMWGAQAKARTRTRTRTRHGEETKEADPCKATRHSSIFIFILRLFIFHACSQHFACSGLLHRLRATISIMQPYHSTAGYVVCGVGLARQVHLVAQLNLNPTSRDKGLHQRTEIGNGPAAMANEVIRRASLKQLSLW